MLIKLTKKTFITLFYTYINIENKTKIQLCLGPKNVIITIITQKISGHPVGVLSGTMLTDKTSINLQQKLA